MAARELIVTADDFGYTQGVNRGIIRAHTEGIVTSTSLMVNGVAAHEASELSRYPELSVGLHFAVTGEGLGERLKQKAAYRFMSDAQIKEVFLNQVECFQELTGKLPDHVNGHHHMHRHPRIARIIGEYAATYDIPVRGSSNTHFVAEYFGWDMFQQPAYDRISINSLALILQQLPPGKNELMCHPGMADDELRGLTRYANEREKELEVLVSDEAKKAIEQLGIRLVGSLR